MQSVFIRHLLSSTPDILEGFWQERLIAVHYDNIRSTKPEDYSKAGKDALRRLWRYCESGAVVGATFTRIKPASILVGEIRQGSQVEVTACGNYFFKTVRLDNAQEISFRDHPLLAAIQPRQGTITGWPSAGQYLEAILRNQQVPREVSSLAPSQLEVVCYEYLRSKEILKFLLLPIGRTLPDIDIYGINAKNENIIAQVTQSRNRNEIERKVNSLKAYKSDSTKLFFFGPHIHKLHDPAIEYISVEEVFKEVDVTHPQPISRMLGLFE